MLNTLRRAAIPATFILALLPTIAAHAQQKITIGTAAFPGSGDNAFPFGVERGNSGDYSAGAEYQEIYPSADFGLSSPVVINDIAFASSSRYGAGATATYNVSIGLSNSSAAANSGGTDYAANKGANFQTVFSGPLTATLKGNNTFDLTFPTTPFLFDPSHGNLLFDVVFNTAATSTGPEDFIINYSGQTQRIFQSSKTGTVYTDSEGLYTQFTVTPVPEISTTASLGLLLALGAGSFALAARRKAKKSL